MERIRKSIKIHIPISQLETECDIQEKRKGNIDHLEDLIMRGKFSGELEKLIKSTNPLDLPIFLDPDTATWFDVALHAKVRQNLADSTIEKHLRTARFMATHIRPIDFRNLNIEDFIHHLDYRRNCENATRNALRHERDAVYMFLRAFKQMSNDWKIYVTLPKKTGGYDEDPFVLNPDQLNALYHGEFGKTTYENVLFQTIVFTAANFGMRPPSEIINIDLKDVVINAKGYGYLWITEKKKGNRRRQYTPHHKKFLSSPVYRTIGNYIKTWRPTVADETSGNALFLQKNGRRITGKYLRDHISKKGKEIVGDDAFKLYTLRHTFATYYYDWTKNLKKVAKRLGHKNTGRIDHYVTLCDDIKLQSNRKSNLFDQALRQYPQTGGKLGRKRKRDSLGKKALSRKTSSVDEYGPGRNRTEKSRVLLEIVEIFLHYLKDQERILSLFFFYYIYKTLIKNIRVIARNTAFFASPKNSFFAVLAVSHKGGVKVLFFILDYSKYTFTSPFLHLFKKSEVCC